MSPLPAAATLRRRFGERLRAGEPLAPLTTYRVGGPAAFFLDVETIDDLAAIAEIRAATDLDVLVIGRGSNMLVADAGFEGLAISVAALADRIELPGPDDECVVEAGGGVSLPVLARRTAAASITGFEWAVGVPGSVGGAVRMNAGGHGSDIAASLLDVELFDLDHDPAGDAVQRVQASTLGLRFRASSLQPGQVVLSARLALGRGDRERSEQELAEIVRWRREHQPGGQNCGSVFVNPVPGQVTAGGLIDGLGLRGFRIGSASVSDKHANFIQSEPGGRAADVHAVIEAVRRRVAEATGYLMRSEVRLVGFGDEACDADPFDLERRHEHR